MAELEFGREDHRLVEVRLAVGEAEVVALADLDLVGRVEDRGPADELADRPLAAARIAAERAADGPGNPREDLEPGEPRPRRLRDQGGQGHRRTGLDHVALDGDVREDAGFRGG